MSDFQNLLGLRAAEVLVPTAPGPNDPRPVYEHVGHALTVWETLEERLCDLFRAYLGTINPSAKRAYGAIVSNQARVGMIKQIIQERYMFDETTRSLHMRAMDRISELAGRRNEIAHGVVSNPSVNDQSFGYCLMPPDYNAGKTRTTGEYFARVGKSEYSVWLDTHLALNKYVYTPLEIARYTEMFMIARQDVQAVWLQLFQQSATFVQQIDTAVAQDVEADSSR